MKKSYFSQLAAASVVLLFTVSWSFAEETLNPELVNESEYHGRKSERYEHGTLPSWGAANPEQRDYFYVVAPKDGDAEGRPLYVALHSAGGSGEYEYEIRKGREPETRNIYLVPDGFYGLFPDCGKNRDSDWWYGGRHAHQGEITDDLKSRATEIQAVEKRILAEIAWVVEKYKIDPNRIYLCGNSMGGSGTLGLGLRNGQIFAAIKANVPAGVWHAYDRLKMDEENAPEDMVDPPVCLDYSAPNDDWSEGHEALFKGMEARKYSYIAYWGNFGHENLDEKVAQFNDLFNTFAWTEIRKNEAYAVFTNASTDNPCPWPERAADAPSGQRGAYFRWKSLVDTSEHFEIELRLASADELKSTQFTAPEQATADVSLRRLQEFKAAPNEKIQWCFGELSGEVVADKNGLVTIPRLTIETTAKVLSLKK